MIRTRLTRPAYGVHRLMKMNEVPEVVQIREMLRRAGLQTTAVRLAVMRILIRTNLADVVRTDCKRNHPSWVSAIRVSQDAAAAGGSRLNSAVASESHDEAI